MRCISRIMNIIFVGIENINNKIHNDEDKKTPEKIKSFSSEKENEPAEGGLNSWPPLADMNPRS